MAYKPEGYNSASPYLIVRGAQQVIDFLVGAFDAEPLRRYETADGSIMHAEVRIDDTVIMMGEAGEGWPPAPAHVHVYVRDVDDAHRRALAGGGVEVQPPTQREGDPDRRGA